MEKYRPHKIKPSTLLLAFELLIAAALLIAAICIRFDIFAKNEKDPSGDGVIAVIARSTAAPTAAATVSPEPKTQEPTPVPTEEPIEPTQTPKPQETRQTGPILNEPVEFPSGSAAVTAVVCIPESPEGPCPFVVLCHGFGGSKNSGGGFRHIAEALYKQGIASIRIDFAGCGDSASPSTDYCLSEMRRDTAAAVAFMAKAYAVDPQRMGMIGYSLGGRVVLETLAAAETDPFAILLIAPAASTKDFIRLCGGSSAWNAKKAEAQTNGYASIGGVKLGPEFFLEFEQRESPTDAAAANFRGRAAVVYANDDKAVLPEVSRATAERLGCETLVLDGCGHMYGMQGGPNDPYILKIIGLALRLFGQSA